VNRLVDASWPRRQGRLEEVSPVGRQEEDHVRVVSKAVHLIEQGEK